MVYMYIYIYTYIYMAQKRDPNGPEVGTIGRYFGVPKVNYV